MKLVVAIVQKEDAGKLLDALTEKGHGATRINTAGGFLKEGNATVLVGVDDAKVDEVLSVLESSCNTRTQYINPLPPVMEPGEFYMPYPVEVQVGGATVFVLSVDRYERL
ncbi:MAG TPA: cyclic-di-AMP receptor [Chloroflexota bacterium]|nr:cyclic-di-AMP receptor [Chloroflexota bacterium]